MVDSLLIKLAMFKYNFFSKEREKKNLRNFLKSSSEVRNLLNSLDKGEIFHLLLHSHYDPAWFARRSVTRKMLGSFYKKVMRLLDTYSEYRFTADSQTQIVEDILANVKPGEYERIKTKLIKYISEGRLIVGPYYAGIDLNLSSGVVLRRNLLYGIRDARKLGWNGEHAGWMIDQFGFPAQMWQLHKKFGIEGIILWRGLGLKPDEACTEIILESPDGSRLLGKWLFVQGYRFGLYVGKYSDIGVPRLIQESKKIEKYSRSKNLLIMDGYEGESAPDNPMEVMEKLRRVGGRVKISTPRMFLAELLQELDMNTLPVVRGYQNYGYYSPVLKGVISARQYIKQAHQLCDDTLSKIVEPFSMLAELFKISQDWSKIENLWRNLIRMASHDELGGCGIDDIHRDSFEIYRQIYSEAVSVIYENMEALALNISLSRNPTGMERELFIPFVAFNSLPFRREEVVRVGVEVPEEWENFKIYDEKGHCYKSQRCGNDFFVQLEGSGALPALGYRSFFIVKEESSKVENLKGVNEESYDEAKQVRCGKNWMENEFIRIDINDNGTFDLKYKTTGTLYRNLGYLRVEPDRGDTYDFSHIENHRVITSLGETANIERVVYGELMARFRIGYRLMVPSRISEDRREWVAEKIPLVVTVVLSIYSGSERLDVDLYINNTLKDSRIRVCFPVITEAESIFVNRQFDVHRMPINGGDLSVREKEEIFQRMNGMISSGMDVVEVKTNINFKWVDVPICGEFGEEDDSGGINEGFGIINRANFEFEVRGDKKREKIVELTLLRSVGWNARADLLTRNINAGWEIYTPDAYCYGNYFFPLSLLPHKGDWKVGKLHREAEKRYVPIVISKLPGGGEGKLPANFSLFEVVSGSVVVSEITKSADNEEKLALIIYNPDEESSNATFAFSVRVKSVDMVDLNEKFIRAVKMENDKMFTLTLGKKEIAELLVEIDRGSLVGIDGTGFGKEVREKEVERELSLVLPHSLDEALRLKMEPHVERYEVDYERQRWLGCRRVYKKELLKYMTSTVEVEGLDGFIDKYRREEELINLENTVKEAHYSYLLTLKRYYETIGKERAASRVEKSIAKMGRELINLRVKKREAEIYRVFFENLKNLSF